MKRVLLHLPKPGGVEGARALLRSWFFDVPWDDLTRDDVAGLLAWAVFGQREKDMSSADRAELAGVMDIFENKTQANWSAPKAPVLPCMQFTWQPINYGEHVIHYPLTFYLFIGALDMVTGVFLRSHGFTLHSAGGQGYWHREAVAQDPASHARPASVFIHGVGIGLLPYCWHVVPCLLDLQHRDRLGDVFLLRQPHIAMGIGECNEPPSTTEAVEAVEAMLAQHGHTEALFIGHSYGTFLMSQLCRLRSDLLCGAVFLDPMCFMLHLGTTTYNFLYAAQAPTEPDPGIIRKTLRSELLINLCLRRHFFWTQSCLWKEDLEAAGLASGEGACSATVVAFTMNDGIIPVDEVLNHLSGSVDLLVSPTGEHGTAITEQWFVQKVFERVELLLTSLPAGCALSETTKRGLL